MASGKKTVEKSCQPVPFNSANMATSLTNESKNSLSISNESKNANATFGDADIAWKDAMFPWNHATTILGNESKNNVTITNETKS